MLFRDGWLPALGSSPRQAVAGNAMADGTSWKSLDVAAADGRKTRPDCCSAPNLDPTVSCRINKLRHRSASTPRADQHRQRLLKVGARVVEKAARVRIHLASACPDAALFRLLAGRFATSGP